MTVPKTLTEAMNSQPAIVSIVAASVTSTNTREVPYSEVYRESTGIRETPVERLQRLNILDRS
jgi:hypothetical protein